MASDPISSCIFSELVDGVLRVAVALDAAPGETASGKSLETMQPLGLIARPRDPEVLADGTTGAAANAMYVFSGGEGFVMPLLDPRFVTKVPPVKKGGTALYSAPGGILNFDGDDGSALLLVPAKSGDSHVLSLDFPTDAIQLRHSLGHGLVMMGDGKHDVLINNVEGDAAVSVNDDGVLLNGNTTAIGSVAVGMPPPPGAPDPRLKVALAPAHIDFETALAAIVGKLCTFANGIAPGTVTPEALTDLALKLAALSTHGQSQILTAAPTP